MRVIKVAILACLGMGVAACATPGSQAGAPTGGQSGAQSAAACDGFIQPGSALRQELAKGDSSCFPTQSGDGRDGHAYIGVTYTLTVFMFKGHGPKTRAIQPNDTGGRSNFVDKALPQTVPVQLDGTTRQARLSRRDDIKTHQTEACLTSYEGETLTFVCRAVGPAASDEQVLAVAQQRIAPDFTAMMP